jgi:hypothetical protein
MLREQIIARTRRPGMKPMRCTVSADGARVHDKIFEAVDEGW